MLPSFSLENTHSSTATNQNTTLEFDSAQISEQINDQQPTYRYGFFMVDNEILDQYGAELGPYAFTVYSTLCRYADRNGQCFPAVPTIAAATGMCETSVRNALNTLESHNLIIRTPCFDSKGGQRSNIYTLVPIEKAPKKDGSESRQIVVAPPINNSQQPTHEMMGGPPLDNGKQNPSYLYTLERELKRNTTREKSSDTDAGPTPVETVVRVGDASTPPQDISNLNHPEQEERLNYVLSRFTELTDKEQPNPRELIQLQNLSHYAKNIIDNTFDAALEWATNPHKTPIRDAAAWLLGTAKRMANRGGTPVKPRNEEPTSEDYRRFNRENGGVILGLSGSIEEGGSYEGEAEDKAKVEVEVKTEPQPQPQSQPPSAPQREALANAKEQMKGEINSITYEMAIEPLALIAVEGERYILQAPSPSMLQFLQKNGIGHVKRLFREWLGQPRAIIDFEAAPQPEPINPTRRHYR